MSPFLHERHMASVPAGPSSWLGASLPQTDRDTLSHFDHL